MQATHGGTSPEGNAGAVRVAVPGRVCGPCWPRRSRNRSDGASFRTSFCRFLQALAVRSQRPARLTSARCTGKSTTEFRAGAVVVAGHRLLQVLAVEQVEGLQGEVQLTMGLFFHQGLLMG